MQHKHISNALWLKKVSEYGITNIVTAIDVSCAPVLLYCIYGQVKTLHCSPIEALMINLPENQKLCCLCIATELMPSCVVV